MRPRKNTTLILFLSLLLAAFTAVSAQSPSQGDQKTKAESCCSMESCCCCSGDSCDMKMKHDATMKHDMKNHKGDCCKAKAKKAA
ncbi:MAG TPA: hypothetical protein VGQ41_25185 [Pyrinomonadaceae bacterium]|jgi:cytochrome c-type biogenesis protein CcmH/NrfF|nr:hypothetical protein [Pyrinomonadaceae bacterium]